MTEERHPFKHSRRATEVRGFGIDKTALAADAVRSDWPVLRMENLDTDLPLPPEAISETIAGLEHPASNSWLPFTGDMDLRAAISEFTAERTGHRYDPASEIIVTSGGTSAILDVLLATVDPGDEVLLTDPTYAGIVNRVRVAGGVPKLVPYRVENGEWRLDLDAFAQAAAAKPAIAVLMSPSMPSGATLTPEEWDAVAAALIEHDVPLLYDAAMERLLFDDRPLVHPVTLPRDGRAHRHRRLALQGAPDDRLARGLGRRSRRVGRVGRLDARLQHDDADRAVALPGRRGAARRPGARGRVRGRARGAARPHPRRARGLARRPAGRRLVAADRRDRARHDTGGAVAGSCSRTRRSPPRRCSAGAAMSRTGTCGSSSAPSRASGWRRSPTASPGRAWRPTAARRARASA